MVEPEPPAPAKETPVIVPTSTTPGGFEGEDLIEVALRMANEMTDPVLDLEDSLNPTPINPGDLVFRSICIKSRLYFNLIR